MAKIRLTCFSTAASVTTSASAMPRLDLPSAISASTWCSRGVSAVQRVVLAAPSDHQRDDLGVERRAALRDPAHRVGERVHVGDRSLSR